MPFSFNGAGDEEGRGKTPGLLCDYRPENHNAAPTYTQEFVSRALVLCTVLSRSRE